MAQNVQVNAYSMLNVAATLDGVSVRGFMDGDNVVEVAPGADAGSMMIGAAGDGLFSGSADRSATITLRLQHTSPTHRQLIQKWKAQRAGRFVGFPFDVIDTGSGCGDSADRCFIQRAPTESKGANATVREWVLVTADCVPMVPDLS